MLAATSPSCPSPNSCAPSDSSALVPWLLAIRSRACSRSACAISCPSTIATSSSVSCSLSSRPVNTAILPPGMQKALTCLLPIRFTSQRHWRARAFQRGASSIRRLEMERRRRSCALLSGASAPLLRASCSSSLYCCVAAVSSSSAGTSVRRRELWPTSTCASAEPAAVAPAASRKARRAIHGDALAAQSRHMGE
jgi:hypothetical protein